MKACLNLPLDSFKQQKNKNQTAVRMLQFLVFQQQQQQQQALFAWLQQHITVLQKQLKFNY